MSNIYEYRSCLKNKDISSFVILGIVAEMILSETILKDNDISEFSKNVFEIELKELVTESRTATATKLLEKISSSNEQEIQKYRKKMLNYIEEKFYNKESDNKKQPNNNLSKWIRKRQTSDWCFTKPISDCGFG